MIRELRAQSRAAVPRRESQRKKAATTPAPAANPQIQPQTRNSRRAAKADTGDPLVDATPHWGLQITVSASASKAGLLVNTMAYDFISRAPRRLFLKGWIAATVTGPEDPELSP
jgi:hypothetical protein